MGNSLSYNITNKDNEQGEDGESLRRTIDEIASNYIFKQNISDMLRFSDSKYRDNFVILTSRILEQNLTNLDISTMKERIFNTKRNPKNTNFGEIVYFAEVDKMKSSFNNETEKKEAIMIISKFYVKILTLFSSIVSVIDPQYIYKDENGEEKFFYLKDYDDLKMMNVTTNKLKLYHLENPLTLVKRRLFILKNKMEQQDDNGDYIVINPGEELCSMNVPENNSGVFNLSNEIGIKELDDLYYDLYDEETSKWSGRSKDMEEQYKRDVTLFYQIFTGKKKKPSKITSFADIELLDFHNLQRCKNNDYFEDLLVSKNDVLFQKYLTKIEEIQQGTKSYKKQLLYILKTMFIKNEERETETSEIEYTINPDFNLKTLSEIQKKVKNCIVQMYTNCEKNFIEALLLYEKMYETRYGELVNAQVNNINFKQTNQSNNKKDDSIRNDLFLNGDLLLDNKIKMPSLNNNRFKYLNSSVAEEPVAEEPAKTPNSVDPFNTNLSFTRPEDNKHIISTPSFTSPIENANQKMNAASSPVPQQQISTSVNNINNDIQLSSLSAPTLDSQSYQSQVSPIPSLVESSPTPSSIESSPIPSSVESSPIPSLIESSPIPSLVESSPIPSLVESSPIPSLVESSPLPPILPTPPVNDKSSVPEIENVPLIQFQEKESPIIPTSMNNDDESANENKYEQDKTDEERENRAVSNSFQSQKVLENPENISPNNNQNNLNSNSKKETTTFTERGVNAQKSLANTFSDFFS